MDELLCGDVMFNEHPHYDSGSGCIEKWAGNMKKIINVHK
jgi:hypothetical protein